MCLSNFYERKAHVHETARSSNKGSGPLSKAMFKHTLDKIFNPSFEFMGGKMSYLCVGKQITIAPEIMSNYASRFKEP